MIGRLSRPVAIVLGSILLGGCLPPAPAPVPPVANKLGIHLLLDDGAFVWPEEQWPEHIAAAGRLTGPGGWVVELIRMDDLDPARWQRFLDACRKEQLRPILRLATNVDKTTGFWRAPPPDPDGRYHGIARRFAEFIGALHWAGDLVVTVGNEPNRGDEWGGLPDPRAYARYLIDVARALKADARHIITLNAGLDQYAPNSGGQPIGGVVYVDAPSFLAEMLAAEPGFVDVLDGWASHPYPIGFSSPPDVQQFLVDGPGAEPGRWNPPPGIANRGINGYRWELYQIMTARPDRPALPVYITETGWRHAETQQPSLDQAGATLPSSTIGAYAQQALRGSKDGGKYALNDDKAVVAVAFFALAGRPDRWGHTNWLLTDPGDRIIGSYPQYEIVRGG